MKRKIVTLPEVRQYLLRKGYGDPAYVTDLNNGIMALVDVSDFGFCRDGVTKYYLFDLGDMPCVFYKR